MLQYLENQVSEKKQRHNQETESNRQYIIQVREQEHQHKIKEDERLSKAKIDALAHSNFIKNQMTKPVPLGSEAHLAKKYELGGMMNAEEARMNKALLHEIARKRVGDKGSPESKSRC